MNALKNTKPIIIKNMSVLNGHDPKKQQLRDVQGFGSERCIKKRCMWSLPVSV